MSTPETAYVERDEPGRLAAFIAYAFYLLSIPSAAVFAVVGVIVAYIGRSDAGPIARAHLDNAIRLFWIACAWGVGLFIATILAWPLVLVLIGIPLLWLIGLAAFILMIWFTVMSLIGAIRLYERRAP